MSRISRFLEPQLVEYLNHLQLAARSAVAGSSSGQHKSPVRGPSVEFRQHRFYVAGDEPRRLDWRILARTDRPYVKEYDEETNLRCALLLDRSGSMGYGRQHGPKLDYAAKLTAALAYVMLGRRESVGLGTCGARGIEQWLAPASGPMQLARVLDMLEHTNAQGPSDMAQAMHSAAERLERRAMVIVISDFFADPAALRSGLAHLRHERHEVIAFQITDRDEEEFPFTSCCRLRGLEGEGSRVCEPGLARQTYQENLRRHRRALEEACWALRVDFQPLVTDRSLEESLRLFMSRRALRA